MRPGLEDPIWDGTLILLTMSIRAAPATSTVVPASASLALVSMVEATEVEIDAVGGVGVVGVPVCMVLDMLGPSVSRDGLTDGLPGSLRIC